MQHRRATAASMFQNSISQNTKCDNMVGFPKSSHIYCCIYVLTVYIFFGYIKFHIAENKLIKIFIVIKFVAFQFVCVWSLTRLDLNKFHFLAELHLNNSISGDQNLARTDETKTNSPLLYNTFSNELLGIM